MLTKIRTLSLAAAVAIATSVSAMAESASGDADPGQMGPVGSAASELEGIIPASADGRAVLAAHGGSDEPSSPRTLLEHPALGAPLDRRALYDRLHGRSEDAGLDPGRNIVRDGVLGADGPRPATWREVEDGIEQMRRDGRGAAERANGSAAGGAGGPVAGQSTAPAGAPDGRLQSIAACESGGDPAAVDPSGTYRGKYQFDQQTWQSVGGGGDPAAAPEAEQDMRASMLMGQRGGSPWPNC